MYTKVLPYVGNSMAAKVLANGLGVPRIRQADRPGDLTPDTFVINWGKSGTDQVGNHPRIMNRPSALQHITHKLRFFEHMSFMDSDYTIDWDVTPRGAQRFLVDGGAAIARTKLTGHSGQGIVVVRQGDPMPDARLYTQYVPQKAEYRVHFIRTGDGDVMYKTQQKKRSEDRGQRMAQEIQNHKNGYIYAINNVDWLPEREWEELKEEIDRVFYDLDFGAVDVLVAKADSRVYILEVNTAPGLKSPTLTDFYLRAMARRIEVEAAR